MHQNTLSPLPVAEPNPPRMPGVPEDRVKIGWEKFRLSNGLTVIVHENRAAPVVTVDLWYKVGAKDEKPGKTGLAHLFEHLMFGGSRNVPGSYIGNMAQLGAADLNGTTNGDRTNFYQTVPTGALDAVLFMESDRMGHFLETLGSDVLEQQRGVVLNEKRQKEGEPFGMVADCLHRGVFPSDHPYAHTTIGWQADVEGLTLEDAREWFRTYYGPSNAVLVLSGDVDAATARIRVQDYFADIPPGPPLRRPACWVPRGQMTRREILEDRVPNARLVIGWAIPPAGDWAASRLSMAAPILGGGRQSWLYRRLVDELKIALDVGASVMPMMLTSLFTISANVLRECDLDAVEAEIRRVLARFIAEGPTLLELERVKIQGEASLIRALERNQSIADLLAMNETFFGDPGFFEREMCYLSTVTCEAIRQTAAQWLGEPGYTLRVLPYPDLRAEGRGLNRRDAPWVDAPAGIHLPEIREGRLSNGIRVLVAERHAAPLVHCKLLFPRGASLEPREQMGLARLTGALLSRGAGDHDDEAIMQLTQQHAIGLGAGCGLDFSGVNINALHSQLDLALDLQADVARRPRLDRTEFRRLMALHLQGLAGSYASPRGALAWATPGLLYGRGHAYARLFDGTAETLARIDHDDLVAFHSRIFHPHGTSIIVTGDTTLEEMLEKLERRFGDWPVPSEVAVPSVGKAMPVAPGVYLIDRPGAAQSTISAAMVIPSAHELNPLELKAIDLTLGGSFSSRLNMNLRETKHWSYGVHSEIEGTMHERVYAVIAPVQTNRTAQSMSEMLREYRELVSDRPVSAADLAAMRQSLRLGLPARCQTVGDLLDTVETLVQFDDPLDYWSDYVRRLEAVALDKVNALARRIVRPDELVWIVAGDRALVEDDIHALGIGPMHHVIPGGGELYR